MELHLVYSLLFAPQGKHTVRSGRSWASFLWDRHGESVGWTRSALSAREEGACAVCGLWRRMSPFLCRGPCTMGVSSSPTSPGAWLVVESATTIVSCAGFLCARTCSARPQGREPLSERG